MNLGSNLNELGVRKLATISTLPTEKRNQLIENAPPEKTTIIYNLKQIHKTLKNQLIMITINTKDNIIHTIFKLHCIKQFIHTN